MRDHWQVGKPVGSVMQFIVDGVGDIHVLMGTWSMYPPCLSSS